MREGLFELMSELGFNLTLEGLLILGFAANCVVMILGAAVRMILSSPRGGDDTGI